MGNTACCASTKDEAAASQAAMRGDEAVPALGDAPLAFSAAPGCGPSADPGATGPAEGPAANTYRIVLDKGSGGKLGLDVDYMPERTVLPIMAVTGGLAEAWNKAHSEELQLRKGDSILEVNGKRGDVAEMLERCKNEQVLELTLRRALTYGHLVKELEELVKSKGCGPILVRLSWHDAGVFSTGEEGSGCPNAVMRFTDKGEGAFPANAGLPTVALALLAPISQKFCPELISNADLWALAANVAIRVMGGPDIPTHFGRVDATSSSESVEAQAGRLPEGDGGVAHLRGVFHPKGLNDKAIVALSGAHTVGRCHLERSGFDGPWTEEPLRFDNSYFKEMLAKTYAPETTSKGRLQHRHAGSGTIMLPADLALLQDPAFKKHVDLYAADQSLFFADFADSWVRLQENGCTNLRNIL
uniref:Peroxidase n=1 Tax=Alexandrium monilatum TaxID=311494 RepID=A0A7S4VYV9_9DINO